LAFDNACCPPRRPADGRTTSLSAPSPAAYLTRNNEAHFRSKYAGQYSIISGIPTTDRQGIDRQRLHGRRGKGCD